MRDVVMRLLPNKLLHHNTTHLLQAVPETKGLVGKILHASCIVDFNSERRLKSVSTHRRARTKALTS